MPLTAYPGITDKQIAAKYRDGVATDASLRTLGTSATQAAAGTAPAATLATAEAYTDTGVAAAEAFATAADSTVLASAKTYADTGDALLVPKTRTLTAGTGLTGGGALDGDRTFTVAYGSTATTACIGNDSRLSDTRTPTDGTVTTAKIVDANVTYAKIQNVSATDKVLGRKTAAAGVVEEIDCTPVARTLIAQTTQALMRTAGLGTTTVGDAVAVAASAAAARTAIGAVIGTNVQAWSTILDQLAANTGPTSSAWTTTLEGTTAPGVNSYAVQTGRYIQIGKTVCAWGRCQLTAKGTGGNVMTGNVQIAGLPFTSVNNSGQFGIAAFTGVDQVAFGSFLSGEIAPNSTKISLINSSTGTAVSAAAIPVANIGVNCNVIFVAIYEAA